MLARLSRALAFTYQMVILETKNAEHSHEVSTRLKGEFLTQYFGSNPTIHEYVLAAIAEQRRDVALEINRAIKVLGTPSTKSEYAFIRQVAKNCNWELPPYTWASPRFEESEKGGEFHPVTVMLFVMLTVTLLAVFLSASFGVNR